MSGDPPLPSWVTFAAGVIVGQFSLLFFIRHGWIAVPIAAERPLASTVKRKIRSQALDNAAQAVVDAEPSAEEAQVTSADRHPTAGGDSDT